MKRGEIIIVDYPFTDQSASKRRPALVVQSDAIQSPDTLIAPISTSTQQTSTRVAIEPSKEPGSRLTLPCMVRCENLSTVEQSMVLGSIGYLSRQTMRRVDDALRKALGL
jgi:mRNA interferase MazF